MVYMKNKINILIVSSILFLGTGCNYSTEQSYNEQGNKVSGYSSFYEDPAYSLQFLTREFCKNKYSVTKVTPAKEELSAPSRVEAHYDVYSVSTAGKKILVQRHSVMNKKIYDGMFSEFYARVVSDYKSDTYVVLHALNPALDLGECSYFVDKTL